MIDESKKSHNLKNSLGLEDEIISDYKFVLSIENSVCKDYITEKFFNNGLASGVVPIVGGPDREAYEKVASRESFIHVTCPISREVQIGIGLQSEILLLAVGHPLVVHQACHH